ncbi:MAG: hypothetical protein H6988_09170 [Pseudomonadales bacterium]|nr:hypothetical protein [Pseudomonadales bacterium]
MANEPDNYDLVHGDGIPPDDYGRFYAQVATLIRDADETAEIVFCQGTVAGAVTNDTDDQFPHGRGPAYCAQAVTETIAALSANNSPLHIDGTGGCRLHPPIHLRQNHDHPSTWKRNWGLERQAGRLSQLG